MANGRPGDHPITDITIHGLNVFGHGIDQMILDLIEIGAGPEVVNEVDIWTKRAPADMTAQLDGIRKRKRRSVRIRFDWVFPWVNGMPNPTTYGWVYKASVQLSDPDDGEQECWAMLFHIDPSRGMGDGHKTAIARFLSDEAPWDKLTTGTRLWMRFGNSTVGTGEVMPPDRWD